MVYVNSKKIKTLFFKIYKKKILETAHETAVKLLVKLLGLLYTRTRAHTRAPIYKGLKLNCLESL